MMLSGLGEIMRDEFDRLDASSQMAVALSGMAIVDPPFERSFTDDVSHRVDSDGWCPTCEGDCYFRDEEGE